MSLPPPNPLSAYPNNPDSSPSHFAVRQFTPTSITNTLPIVVTIVGSNFTAGQGLMATKFVTIPFARATGMEQLNNQTFYVGQPTPDTFVLCDRNANYIDGRNFTAFVSNGLAQFTLTGPTLPITNPSYPPPPGSPPFPPE